MTALRGLSALGLLSLGAAAAHADAPPLSEVLASSGITATGYVDATYEHVSGIPSYRVFDTEHNAFAFHQAGLTLALQPKEGFGALVQVIAGNDAELTHSYGSTTGDFDVLQGYVQYAGGGWTVIGGKFLTLAGAEVIMPTGNTNVSRSLTFAGEPFTHTGIRATYAATDTFSVIFGVNNGWDQVKDINTQKTGEIGISFAPSKAFVLTAQGYFGTEPSVSGASSGTRKLLDLVATFNATDALSFVLNYDWGRQEDFDDLGTTGRWTAIAGYANFAFSDTWRLSVRLEHFDDKDGYKTGVIQKLKEGTVTLGFMPEKSFELRFEGRYDKSDEDTFTKTTGETTGSQTSFAVEGLYKF